MKPTSDPTYVMPRWLRSWEQFWFTPADPSVLALIRITGGMIVVYTLFAYSFTLQDFMGEHAWHDMEMRMALVHDRPVYTGPLSWQESGALPAPQSEIQMEYLKAYRITYGTDPPPPYPDTHDEVAVLETYHRWAGIDLRTFGLKIPRTDEEKDYLNRYTQKWRGPPPAYAKDKAEEDAINDYMSRHGHDPRRLYSKGMPVFSLWFHVLEPEAMAVVHGLMVFVAFLFTIGFCTRITSALTWFTLLCFIHRNPTILFGVDTMMTIVLVYLMISPCGEVFSVDSVIRRWWRTAKPGVVQGWYRFWKKSVPSAAEIAPAADDQTTLSVAANVAIRFLQIHVCVIYFVSGISKLLGNAWWNGTAIWLTVGNYEFAPMNSSLYLAFLRLLGSQQWIFDTFTTGGGIFTLAFEISYAFLVWRPRLRWVMLGSAVLLHGFIGLFMGLITFSLMMLVLNMAFLRKEEVLWVISKLGSLTKATAAPVAQEPVAVGAGKTQETPIR